MDLGAKHIIVIAHDNSAFLIIILHNGIAHFELVAFNVQLDTGGILLFDDGAIPFKAVVGEGEEGSAQRVEVGDGGRLTVNGSFVCGNPLWIGRRQGDTLFVPGGQVVCVRQP